MIRNEYRLPSLTERLFIMMVEIAQKGNATVLSRKERDQMLRREDFLNAAEELFAEKGYHSTTMEDIAREAGYGTGTIYLYFKKKEELYDALFERNLSDHAQFIDERVKAEPHPRDKIRALIRARIDFFDQHKRFFRILLAEWSTGGSTLNRKTHQRMETMYKEHLNFVTQLLFNAMRAGAIRKIDPEHLATAMSGMISFLLAEWIKKQSKEPIDQIEDFVMDLIMKGLEKPHA